MYEMYFNDVNYLTVRRFPGIYGENRAKVDPDIIARPDPKDYDHDIHKLDLPGLNEYIRVLCRTVDDTLDRAIIVIDCNFPNEYRARFKNDRQIKKRIDAGLLVVLDENPEQIQSDLCGLSIFEMAEMAQNDRDAVIDYLSRIRRQALSDIDELDRQKIDVYKSNTQMSKYFTSWESKYKDQPRLKALSTGFNELDRQLYGGLFPGLYSVGGPTGSGKTSFCLSLMLNLIEAGTPVLYYALEMSKDEIISKVLSNLTETTGANCKPVNCRAIDTKRPDDLTIPEQNALVKAKNEFRQYADNLYIRDGLGVIDADNVIKDTSDFIDKFDIKPVVVVDYLQILKPLKDRENPGRALSDKQAIDLAMYSLKQFVLDHKITMILISSLNRMSYDEIVTLASFKESGAIEYTSDVVIGIYPAILDRISRGNNGGISKDGRAELKAEEQKTKEQGYKDMTVAILKSRFSPARRKIAFKFYGFTGRYVESPVAYNYDDEI